VHSLYASAWTTLLAMHPNGCRVILTASLLEAIGRSSMIFPQWLAHVRQRLLARLQAPSVDSRPLGIWGKLWHWIWLRHPQIERTRFLEGASAFGPTIPGIFSWGLVTGIAMSKSVLTVPQAISMSLLLYAGSAQLAVLPLMAAGLPIWTSLLTALLVNMRFIITSAGLQPHFAYLPFRQRTLLSSFNGDVTFVLFMARYSEPGYEPGKQGYFWGISVTNYITWQVASIVGILLASAFPDEWGLGLAGTLALIPVMMSTLNSRSSVLAVGVAAVISLLLLDLPYRLSLVAAVIGAVAMGMASDEFAARATLRSIRRAHNQREDAS
jgi:predicted branched-subunit amino acid permease